MINTKKIIYRILEKPTIFTITNHHSTHRLSFSKHDHPSIILFKQIFILKELDDVIHPVLVEGFSSLLEVLDLKSIIHLLKLEPRDITYQVPGFHVIFFASLKLNHTLISPFLEINVVIKPAGIMITTIINNNYESMAIVAIVWVKLSLLGLIIVETRDLVSRDLDKKHEKQRVWPAV